MKKIAFMFGVAALFAACGNEVALTAEDSAAVAAALDDSIKAEIAAIAAPAIADTAAMETEEEKAAAVTAFNDAVAKYSEDTAKVNASREARLAANLAAALAAKQEAPADTTGNEEK